MNFSRIAALSCALLVLVSSVDASARRHQRGRGQWTVAEAQEWERRTGVIKGVNQPEPAYPGMTNKEMLKIASDLGFNSVRLVVRGETLEEQVECIRRELDDADLFGMSVQPMFTYHTLHFKDTTMTEEERLKYAENAVRSLVRPFANDKRIVMWDIWNEPPFRSTDPDVMRGMDWLEQMVVWCREEGLTQPISASIIWEDGKIVDTTTASWKRRVEVEGMMDVHNFHDYSLAWDFGKWLQPKLDVYRRMDDRPIVCSECLSRVNGAGVPRTLTAFSREHVHFYLWGLHTCDYQWSVRIRTSTYDPFEPMFHCVLWADGDFYDWRDIEWIRKFHFAAPGEEVDPGLEVTERWDHDRAWKWVSSGPVKGKALVSDAALDDVPLGYNSVRVRLRYSDWDEDRDGFLGRFGSLLDTADARGLTVLPVLLTDDDMDVAEERVGQYVGDLVEKFYRHPAVQAWDLWWHPGEECADSARVADRVRSVFKYARNKYPTQPLTMTPLVRVQKFAPDFDYYTALKHLTMWEGAHGWPQLEYGGGSNSELVYRIWSLSDVLSFSSSQTTPQVGWLVSICYRFGRPIFCTGLGTQADSDLSGADASSRSTCDTAEVGIDLPGIMERFSANHVFWYSDVDVPSDLLTSFRFRPIQSTH